MFRQACRNLDFSPPIVLGIEMVEMKMVCFKSSDLSERWIFSVIFFFVAVYFHSSFPFFIGLKNYGKTCTGDWILKCLIV